MNCLPLSSPRWRAIFVAALSWLGLAQDTAAQTQKSGAPRRAALERVLQELDAAFANSDLNGYLDAFEPDHPGSHAMLGQRLQRAFGCGKPLQRSSVIIGEPRAVGPRTVVRVRHEIRTDAKALAVEVEDTILAFRNDGDTSVVPTFSIITPRSVDCPARDVFRCPPCNYQIGGIPGWLCAPMGRGRAQALEASSFYLLGTDLAVDISVRIAPAPIDADAPESTFLAEELAANLRQIEPNARSGLATNWLPQRHAQAGIRGLDGARIEVDLPPTADAPRGNVALFHVLQLGALQHLLLVRGSKTAVVEHRRSLDSLLASFELLEPDLDRATAGARPLRHHTGGVLDGVDYQNEIHGAGMTGPEGWKAQQRCGGAQFRVLWTSPNGGRLWLTGYAVPPGMTHWCDKTAERWVRRLAESANLKLPDDVGDWAPDQVCAGMTRTLACETKAPPGAGHKRLLRVSFRDDLLMIADGMGAGDADWAVIKLALATLRL